MRRENGRQVTYICDVCGGSGLGRSYQVNVNQHQSTQPANWFSLNVRHDHGAPGERLKAHTCSLDCSIEQLRRWTV